MSNNFNVSQTKENLMKAFAGESQARNRYTFAAQKAKETFMPVVQRVFLFTADQEKEHGEIFYNFLSSLSGENIKIEGSYPVNISDNILDLLRWAEHNEYEEYSVDYANFAKIADEEGYKDIAAKFALIAEIEKTHSERFKSLADMLEQNKLFVSDVQASWMCLNCGFVYQGTNVPEKCPVCQHERGYFLKVEFSPYNFAK